MTAKRATRIWVPVAVAAVIGAALALILFLRPNEDVAAHRIVDPTKAQNDVSSLRRALEAYREHTGVFPTTEQGLQALLTPPKDVVMSWNGPYLETLPIDPWDAPYQYELAAGTSVGFTLYSLGADFAQGGQGLNADIGILWSEPVVPDVPPPPVEDAPFHVETVPAYAQVRIMNIRPAFRDGMELAPGEYRVQVSAAGFYTKEEVVPHGASATTHRVVLDRRPPDQAPFFVETVPQDALVKVVRENGSVAWDSGPMRRPGVQLPPGEYRVVARADGYDMGEGLVMHGASATTHRIVLNRTPPPDAPLFVETVPSNALVKVVSRDGSLVWDARRMRRPGVQLPPGDYRVQVSAQGFVEKREWVSHGASAVALRVTLDRIAPPEQPRTPPPTAAPAPVVQQPRLLERVEPDYPSAARRRSLEGRVVLRFTVSRTGRVEDIEVIEATPRGVFDRAAKAALRQWRYTPKTVDSEPVEVRGAQTQFIFQLDD